MIAIWRYVTDDHRCAVYLGKQLAYLYLAPDVHVRCIAVDAVRHVISKIGHVEHLRTVDYWVAEVRQIVQDYIVVGGFCPFTWRVDGRKIADHPLAALIIDRESRGDLVRVEQQDLGGL